MLSGAEAVGRFAKGERVVFLGDSITMGGGYVFHLQLFEELRHPGAGAVLINAGVSGDSTNEGCKRWGYDVMPMNPERVFVMFGVNDVGITSYKTANPDEIEQGKRRECLDKYADNQRRLADMIQKEGKRLVLMTPPGYDQYGDVRAENMIEANEPGLADCAEIVRSLASERKLGLVEIHAPYTAMLKAHPELHLCGEDRVHPQNVGHLLIAVLILESMGEDGLVAEVTIEARRQSGKNRCLEVISAVNADVSELKADRDGGKCISFKYTPKALPFPCTQDYKTLDTVYPITDKLNREIIRVKNLPNGSYIIKANGVAIASATADELAKGVNIAVCDTPGQRISLDADKVRGQLNEAARLVRNVPYMNTVILRQNGNLDNMEECFQVLDRWLANQANSSNLAYFEKQVSTYKSLRPNLAEKQHEVDELRKKLASFAPVPFVIAIEPK
ncbi:MAG: SGNH/GDSL hydrolase family protein, partial [Victivallales bacterium]|nr:SGNH/GDSL hydrolase family protein [Victivallales bacterium]